MRALTAICLALCSLAMSGCSVVYSVQPLHRSDDAIEKTELVGTWVSDKNKDHEEFCVEKSDHSSYVLVIADLTSKSAQLYRAELVSLEDRLFIDIQFDKQVVGNIEVGDPVGTIPHHVIAKVDLSGDDLEYAALDGDKVLQQNERGYSPVAHLMVDKDVMLLTASTEELREFISKHVDDVFSDSEHLSRKPETDTLRRPCWTFNVPNLPATNQVN